jgi:hypothetical protein
MGNKMKKTQNIPVGTVKKILSENRRNRSKINTTNVYIHDS